METVITPVFQVVYAGKDITTDISNHLVSVSYSDRTQAESDELEITVEDTAGTWIDAWYPAKGDKLQLSIGYDGNLLDCGEFTVDEVEAQGPPDTITIRALAAGINSPLRSKRSQAHEDQTLRQVAETVASRHSLSIVDGTESSRRVKVDYTDDRASLTAAAASGRNALAVNQLSVYVETVRVHYPALLNTADSLTAKGRGAEATEIRQTVHLWRAAWENKALPDIATSRQTILNFATRLDQMAAGLKDVDTTITRSKLDVKLQRVTQDREDDLAFLKRLAERYGILFSVRGSSLTFTSMYDIEGTGGVATITKGEVARYSFRDKTTKTYSSAKVSYHNPAEKKDIVAEVNASELAVADEATSGDVLLISDRVEDEAQAKEVAKAALYRANSRTAEGSIDLPGRPGIVAGINLVLSGFGVMSGTWHVEESQHRIDKAGGYTTSATLKRVAK